MFLAPDLMLGACAMFPYSESVIVFLKVLLQRRSICCLFCKYPFDLNLSKTVDSSNFVLQSFIHSLLCMFLVSSESQRFIFYFGRDIIVKSWFRENFCLVESLMYVELESKCLADFSPFINEHKMISVVEYLFKWRAATKILIWSRIQFTTPYPLPLMCQIFSSLISISLHKTFHFSKICNLWNTKIHFKPCNALMHVKTRRSHCEQEVELILIPAFLLIHYNIYSMQEWISSPACVLYMFFAVAEHCLMHEWVCLDFYFPCGML